MITINYTYTNVKLDTTLIQIVFVNTIVFIDMYTYTNYIYIYIIIQQIINTIRLSTLFVVSLARLPPRPFIFFPFNV